MQLVHDQWIDLLKRFGVVTIVPKPGDAFDPHVHQSVMQEPSDQPAGTVYMVTGGVLLLAASVDAISRRRANATGRA